MPQALKGLTLLALFVLAGCEGDQVGRVASSGFFNPTEIDFGERGVGTISTQELTLRNSAAAKITVLRVLYEPELGAYNLRRERGGSVQALELGPGDTERLVIAFTPLTEGNFDVTAVVGIDDREIELPIRASARTLTEPTPLLEPSFVRFTSVETGRDVSQTVRLTNVGDIEGVLGTMGPVQAPFTLTQRGGAPLPTVKPVLAPGQALELEVHFRATSAGSANDTIPFGFDRGGEGMLTVEGDAVVAGELTCDRTQLAFGGVARGTLSRLTLACQTSGGPWELSTLRFAAGTSPLFRLVNAPSAVGADGSLTLDVEFESVGLPEFHSGRLEIVAAHGAVHGFPMDARVAPPVPGSTDVSLRMSWNSLQTDFDLHLVRNGSPPHHPANDCYFANKNPDWGQAVYTGDDPFLDRDDVDGFGPEELNLTFAREASYEVYVQFYNYLGAVAPGTTVTLDIDLRNQATRTVSTDLNTCGDTWHVGTVEIDANFGPRFIPNGAITSLYRGWASDRCR